MSVCTCQNDWSNKDIIWGQGIRLKKQSGVNLLVRPFNFRVVEEKQLLSIKASRFNGIIISILYKVN
ncbi:hypothetical protein SAMN04488033_11677 [Salegentibacter agarivorans]|uniref:Uncharacterized protein n=1 Tax=Salegentibacter agarivorans TaxID=345907 RepID=A0A1I2MY88_9FLAO|nr:hypothetical protein SAMN04488033_11677 [Salegentibacter agarivorans]